MAYHAELEMFNDDGRANGSILRFWETMYLSEE